jgi:tRNA (guanine37-N1)-methyltransferase
MQVRDVRLDVLTLFPEYFAPLEVSLLGRARSAGLIDVRLHDLRDFTTDRHRTVDDTPYGSGAGMVMKPEPWGAALDQVHGELGGSTAPRPRLVVPSPAGRPFRQADAAELSTAPSLAFACGRYEGIDQRVIDEARDAWEVDELSLGDYVLNGGEVAALAMVEAVVRLLPGVLGNVESLSEESHTDGLLEYPVFTKPAVWRARAVPAVLQSGHHQQIARWRRDESLRRTASVRPDLLRGYSPARCDRDDLDLLETLGWYPSGEGFSDRPPTG